MRTLPAALLDAQKSASAAPYLRATISDLIGGLRRLVWTRVYTGSEPDSFHAACIAGDGSLIRARVTGGHVYYQRVTSPGGASNFSVWTDLALLPTPASRSAPAARACCSSISTPAARSSDCAKARTTA
ncbi:MAG: hypothetical protein ABI559_10610 [Chloroflexota bacterium]